MGFSFLLDGSDQSDLPRHDESVEVTLTILATSDLHAQLSARDYLSGRRRPDIGLTRVASLIREARATCTNTLLFDNGDAIEGSALADHAVATGRGSHHPIVMAMNALGYDAVALGNHEFSHGIEFLQGAVGAMRFPALSANIWWADGSAPMAVPHAVLDRMVTDRAGRSLQLKVGVFGVTPPQVLVWDERRIAGRLAARDMVTSARAAVQALRAAGADIVVGLCHTGLTADPSDPDNQGLALAQGSGVDALVLGHSHQVFPGPDFEGLTDADLVSGTIAGRPVVMPGSHGSHLGRIDMTLRVDAGRWKVTSAHGYAEPVQDDACDVRATVPEDSGLLSVAIPAERRVQRWLSTRVGQTEQPLDSYFTMVADGPLLRTIASAKAAFLQEQLPQDKLAGLPVLAAVAPFRAGGRGGPNSYVDVPAGPLTRRNLADIYVHPNTFSAVVVTAEALADWLERGVSGYVRQVPGRAALPLIDPAFPPFAFETIYGLDYQIDLTNPSRYDARGALAAPGSRRIVNLTWQGRSLQPGMRFAIATNSFRASILPQQLADGLLATVDSPADSRGVLAAWLSRKPGDPAGIGCLAAGGWSFAPLGGQPVLYDTGPGALPHLHRIAHLRPEVLSTSPGGFLRLRLTL